MPKINKGKIMQFSSNNKFGNSNNSEYKVKPNDNTENISNNDADQADFQTGAMNDILKKLFQFRSKEEPIVSELKEKKYISSGEVPKVKTSQGCTISLVAPVSAGKSTLLNSICEYPILPTAATTTSAVPTFVAKARSIDDECIGVCSMHREVKRISGEKGNSTEIGRFVRGKAKVFRADSIDKSKFQDMLDFLLLLTRGTGNMADGATITVDNMVYFLNSVENVDVFLGSDDEKRRNLPQSAFTLKWEEPRHRFVLLMILLCLYVKQDTSNEQRTQLIQKINVKRKELFRKFGLDPNSDYCVNLNWYSNSIPENTTLIDLPGTGSETEGSSDQKLSAHSELVKGILAESDALWILGSDKGITEPDLVDILKDEVQKPNNESKAKICVFNSHRGSPITSKAVEEFISKLPFLSGEKCYVIDALAGEYNFVENSGINADFTHGAFSARMSPYFEGTFSKEYLGAYYKGNETNGKFLYKTYSTTNRTEADDNVKNVIVAVQNDEKYSLESFIKKELSDYAMRLNNEVQIKEALVQLRFFTAIKTELNNNLKFLEGKGDRSAEIKTAVNKTLDICKKRSENRLTALITEEHTNLSRKLTSLADSIGEKISRAFYKEFNLLRMNIQNKWQMLITPCTNYTLKKDLVNYIVKGENLRKLNEVKDLVNNYISVYAFKDSFKTVDREIESYKDALVNYSKQLKIQINGFALSYKEEFSKEYDRQRDLICADSTMLDKNDLYEKFNNSKPGLIEFLEEKMNELYNEQSKIIDTLVENGGLFEKTVKETADDFGKFFSDRTLFQMRSAINRKYESIFHDGWFKNQKIAVKVLEDIIRDDFKEVYDDCNDEMLTIINGIYGGNLLEGATSFPVKVSDLVNDFNAILTIDQNGLLKQLNAKNEVVKLMLNKKFEIITDSSDIVEELKAYLQKWIEIGRSFDDIDRSIEKALVASNNKSFYEKYKKAANAIKE